MSEVKPLIHQLCSMNLFEMGKKKKQRKEKSKIFLLPNEQACELTRYLFYIINKGYFGFSSPL